MMAVEPFCGGGVVNILHFVACLLGRLFIGLIGSTAVVAASVALAVAARDAYRGHKP